MTEHDGGLGMAAAAWYSDRVHVSKSRIVTMSSEARLPEPTELEQLPLRARIAFAARCARRVQPLFSYYWPAAGVGATIALDWVVGLAECLASRDIRPRQEVVEEAVETLSIRLEGAPEQARVVALAALEAANSAKEKQAPNKALRSAIASHPSLRASTCIQADYEAIRDAAEQQSWSDASPVPTTLLGPLWPHGLPSDWPAAAIPAQHANGFDLRSWALQAFPEEEFLAGYEEILRTGGHSLDEILPELERLVEGQRV